jgi:gluconolactonase
MKQIVLPLLLMLTAIASARCAQSKIIAEGAQVTKLAGGFTFTEGVVSDPKGNVFFTDQPSDRILEWSLDGKLSTFMQPCGRANGLCFDKAGNLWACADNKNELWRIAPDRKVTVVLKEHQGKLLNGPNDVWVLPHGGLFFTDPFYKREWWKRGPSEQPKGVYYLSADEKVFKRVIEDMKMPNGIIGTPNGKVLYVSDIDSSETYRYKIEKDGSLSGKQLFCKLGSDGMTIDNKGNVYLTGKGVFVFDPTGTQIEQIPIPENWCGNVCFGGKDRHTIFVSASRGLYSLKMKVKGVGSQ